MITVIPFMGPEPYMGTTHTQPINDTRWNWITRAQVVKWEKNNEPLARKKEE